MLVGPEVGGTGLTQLPCLYRALQIYKIINTQDVVICGFLELVSLG